MSAERDSLTDSLADLLRGHGVAVADGLGFDDVLAVVASSLSTLEAQEREMRKAIALWSDETFDGDVGKRMRDQLDAWADRAAVGNRENAAWPPEREDAEMWCDRCHRRHGVIWVASNDLWNAVMREGDRGKPDEFNFCCPICFMQLADARGVGNHMWDVCVWEIPPDPPDVFTAIKNVEQFFVQRISQDTLKASIAEIRRTIELLAADTTAADLRQEIEFLKAESGDPRPVVHRDGLWLRETAVPDDADRPTGA